MRNFLLLITCCLFVYGSFAQQIGTLPKLSPLTKKYLNTLKAGSTALPKGYVYKTGSDAIQYISALIKVSDAALAQEKLDMIHAFIGTKAGNIWTVQVPADKVAAFSALPGIAYIQLDEPVVIPNLDSARKTTRVDSVHKGINLPMPYSGKNVVVGIIDFGFDYNHPTFYDTLGTTYRIRKVWELNTDGTPPTGYNYGHELTDTNTIKAQGTDNEVQTHGTGVGGMAAGSGYGSNVNSRFRGMAYDAEMILVGVRRDSIGEQWKSSGFSDFIDGINYIFTQATAMGKPAVVNISWGSQSGPHDGSTLFNQACDALTAPAK